MTKKYLKETVVRNDYEWRIIGQLGSPITEVVTLHGSRQFPNSRTAYAHVLRAVKRIADDLQQVQPGATVQLPFANGAPKPMSVLTNDATGLTLSDPATGQQMMIPHLNGAPQVAQPATGGSGMAQPPAQGNGMSTIAPGTGLKQSGRKTAMPLGLPLEPRPYRCRNCGHEQMEATNHTEPFVAYCGNCSWKPSFGKAENAIPFNGRTYRPFDYAGDTRVGPAGRDASRKKVAFPPPPSPAPGGPASAPPTPGGTPAPGGPPVKPERPELPNQNPELGAADGRMLTRHEIIQECETLIRNALWRGVRIGTKELVQYLQQQYSNKPDELYEGAQKAWGNVRYEDDELFNRAEGPGPDAPGGAPQSSGMPGTPQRSEPAEWGMDDEQAPPHAMIR